jgi:adenine-specific DNA-methyltransferase
MGCEIFGEYYGIAIERTKLAMNGKLKTRPMNKPIYDPNNPKINLDYEEREGKQLVLFNKTPVYDGIAK